MIQKMLQKRNLVVILAAVTGLLPVWVYGEAPGIYQGLKDQPNSFMIPEINQLGDKSYLKTGNQQIYANADSLDFVGTNIVASGNVEIKFQDVSIRADKAIVNIKNKDIDAKGNIVMRRNYDTITHLTLEEFLNARKMPDRLVEIIGYRVEPTGGKKLICRIYQRGDMFKAERLSGNLLTGVLEFDGFAATYKKFSCVGKSATRATDGTITVTDASVSTCEYLEDDQEHYSVGCGRLVIAPRVNPSDLKMYNPDMGEHSYWGYNCTFSVAGVPVAWLPMVYKPADESPGIAQIRAGSDSDWGWYIQTSKKFHLYDYPNTETRLYLDYYSKHGLGYGQETWVDTPESKTSLFTYFIYDSNPDYGGDDDIRMSAPNQRYDIKFNNMTHLTPRLDFRTNIEKLSDYYVLRDFFEDRDLNDPQPTSYLSLENQFDRFSAGLYVQPHLNNFYTDVQKLPEFRIDVPRQELFKNLYYQGETSAANMRMTFRDFDEPRTAANGVDPESYGAFRFDTLHMFYYPIKLDWLNIVPRAGGRFTGYSESSKTKLNDDDLYNMFIADDPDLGNPTANVINYDGKGGQVYRFAGEIGVETNTKIYRSWQNVRNSFWQLDGLRHVMVPYTNYTFIPEPTTSPDKIYYFDDTDRISRQNFVRFGLKNRLQTRRGEYGKEQIYEWGSVENYVDYHFNNSSKFKHLGNFGTILKFNPTSRLSITSLLLIDPSSNKDPVVNTNRNGIDTGERVGLSAKWIDRWQTTIRYRFLEDASTYISYYYQDAYRQRSAYSMGSTLSDIESGSAFERYYGSRAQQIRWGIDTLLPFDRNTKIGYEIFYDVEAGFMREQRVSISRIFHCFQVAVVGAQEIQRGNDNGKETNNSLMVTLTLTSLPGVKSGQQRGYGPGEKN